MAVDRNSAVDARFDVPPGLAIVHDPKVIWAEQHKSSLCWLTIREAGPCMIIQWRTVAGYSATPYTVENHCPTLNAQKNLGTAVKRCEELLIEGPSESIRAKRDEHREKKQKAGAKGGDVRATRARESDNHVIEARRLAEKFGFATIPAFDPRKWTFGADDNVKGAPRLYLTRNGTNEEVTVELIHKGSSFKVRRYWPSSFDDNASSILEDDVREFIALDVGSEPKSFARAVSVVERIVLTEPQTWNRGDVTKFLD